MRFVLSGLLILLMILTGAAYLMVFTVNQTQHAVVLEFGRMVAVESTAGLKFKLPWHNVLYFEKRILAIETQMKITDQILTADQKPVVVNAFARYRITNPLQFYQSLNNTTNGNSQIENALNTNLRRVVSSSTQQDLVRGRREQLMRDLTEQVRSKAIADKWGVEIVDVRINRAELPEKIRESVFANMRAERQQEAADIRGRGEEQARRIKAEADRDVTVIKAEATRDAERRRGEGDAARNKTFADAFGRDPDFFAFYRSMQAYEQGLKGQGSRMVLSPDSAFFRYFKDPFGGSGATYGKPAP